MSLTPTGKKEFRQELARYLLVAIKYRNEWDYDQVRPFWGYDLAPSAHHRADCSAFGGLSYYAAGRHSGYPIMDPLGNHYSGIGNTSSCYATLKAHHAPVDKYRVGDIALYLEGEWWHHHMTICCIAGTGSTAVWASNGSQRGPLKESLHYRTDLTAVLRHPALL